MIWNRMSSKTLFVKSNPVGRIGCIHSINRSSEKSILRFSDPRFKIICRIIFPTLWTTQVILIKSQTKKMILPVTLVPITKGNGISSGNSLKCVTSATFLCCRSLILARLACKADLSSAKNAVEQRRGFPINLLTLHHSTRVKLRALSRGNDSLRQMQKSLSPLKRGLAKK